MLIFAGFINTDSNLLQNSTLPATKTIYIIRHGQTDYNKLGIVQGSGVDTDLNNTGKNQALKFFHHYKDIAFDKIYVSQLKRTHQTVAPWKEQNIPIEIIPELNEINWGIMEGLTPSPESHKKFTDTVKQWSAGNLDLAVENGETPNEMFERQKKGLNKILENPGEQNILICMHGRAMRSFLCLLTNTPLHKMDEFEHGNVCLYILDQLPNSAFFHVRVRNSRVHLHNHIKK